MKPPYYAVIFTARRTTVEDGYDETAERMVALASEQPGFLGIESAQQGDAEITVSYWASEEAIRAWKRQIDHGEAQAAGRRRWYSEYRVRVARVERDYGFNAPGQESADA